MLCPAASCMLASEWHVRQSLFACAFTLAGTQNSALAANAKGMANTIFIVAPVTGFKWAPPNFIQTRAQKLLSINCRVRIALRVRRLRQ